MISVFKVGKRDNYSVETSGKREREARKRRNKTRRTVITFKIWGDGSEEKRLKLGKRKLADWERWRRHHGGGWTSYR